MDVEITGRIGPVIEKSKGKDKITIVQALRLCTGCTAHRGIAVLYRH